MLLGQLDDAYSRREALWSKFEAETEECGRYALTGLINRELLVADHHFSVFQLQLPELFSNLSLGKLKRLFLEWRRRAKR